MANLRLTRCCIFMIPVRFGTPLPDRQMVGGGYTVSDTARRYTGLSLSLGAIAREREEMSICKGSGSGPGALTAIFWDVCDFVFLGRMTQDSEGRRDPQQKRDATFGGFSCGCA